MPKNVTIYTTNTCASCSMVKRWLDSKSIAYDVINLDEQPERRAEAQAMSGATTVPVTVVTKSDDSKEVVTGWNLSKLAPAIQ